MRGRQVQSLFDNFAVLIFTRRVRRLESYRPRDLSLVRDAVDDSLILYDSRMKRGES